MKIYNIYNNNNITNNYINSLFILSSNNFINK